MINLTPHTITIRTPEGDVTIPPSGQVARVSTAETVVGSVLGVQVVERRFFEVEGLPPAGTPCLVSALVLSACPGRAGVYAPDSGPTAVRENGQVVAVTRLVAA
jgi:hypothetical protein